MATASTSRVLHTANAGSFLVGTVQGHAALPTRVALLRRLGGAAAPELSQVALADAPILLLEVCTSALLAAVAATAVPAIPGWAPAALMGGALIALGALRLVHLRFRHRSLARGLAVLADPGARNRLVGLVLALTGAALVRTWLVLLGFGLPAGPADAALLLFSMGAIGLLPLGAVGTAPTATVAAMGASDLTERGGRGHGDRHLDGPGGAALRRGMLGLAGTLRGARRSVGRARRGPAAPHPGVGVWAGAGSGRIVLLQGIHVREGPSNDPV